MIDTPSPTPQEMRDLAPKADAKVPGTGEVCLLLADLLEQEPLPSSEFTDYRLRRLVDRLMYLLLG